MEQAAGELSVGKPEVAFHFNAPDKVAYASRLLRKAYLKGARLLVLAKPQDAAALDQLLWAMAAVEFVPHCREDASPAVRALSPICIASGAIPEPLAADVLLNIGDAMPADYHRFARVIEVVSLDESDRRQARERWRQYQATGLEPQRHDLKASA
jgi:DNA polymerase III subunit chi